jgi:hypothetical protein
MSAAVCLACIGSASAAQYETHMVDLHHGFTMVAFVGHTPEAYAQAQRAAKMWEARRVLGLGPQTITARAFDHAEMAQLRLPSGNEDAVAEVHTQ